MNTAKETYVDNKARTVLECTLCGATTYVKAGIDTKSPKDAIKRSCRNCSAPLNLPINEGWWKEFGLKKNPGGMDRCHVCAQAFVTGLRRREEWDTWLGHGTTNTKKSAKESQSHDGFRATTIS